MKKILFLLFITSVCSVNAITVTRSVFPKEFKIGQETIITIKVKKEGEEGFAKLMEEIPKGFEAEELNSATGNYNYDNGKLKIIWLVMPEGDEFTAEYKLRYVGNKPGEYSVTGNFYYVNDGKRFEKNLGSTALKVVEDKSKNEVEPILNIAPSDIAKKSDVKADIVSGSDSVSSTVADTASTIVKGKTEITKDAPTPTEEVEKVEPAVEKLKSEVVFKVQLGVFSSEKDLSLFGDLPDVHFIKVGKFYKYYSGKYPSEDEARKNVLKAKSSGFPGAFIVPFKDGKRI